MKVIVEEPSPEIDFWLLTTGDGFKLVETGALYIKVSGNKAFNVQDNVLCPMEIIMCLVSSTT